MQRLMLSLASLPPRLLFLRPLDGVAELIAEPGDPGSTNRLLQHLLIEPNGAPTDVDALLGTWRDRALAALFEREFGGRVDARALCNQCGESFGFAFALAPILAEQADKAAATGLVIDEEGWWTLRNGARLRPPTLGDLSRHSDPQTLLAAVSEGKIPPAEAEALLDVGAPLLAIDLETRCPSCSARQDIEFEIGSYFIEAIAAERPLLIRETHLIASRYAWSRESIMALPRGDRRAYAQLIIGERSAAALKRAG